MDKVQPLDALFDDKMSMKTNNDIELVEGLETTNDDHALSQEELHRQLIQHYVPKDLRRRIHAIECLDGKNDVLREAFHAQVKALEREFEQRHAVIYAQRRAVITGDATDAPDADTCRLEEETQAHRQSLLEEAGPNVAQLTREFNQMDDEMLRVRGIPDFWATALSNHPVLNAAITDLDIGALRFLQDIRGAALPDRAGFTLTFEFSSNPYFANRTLTKTYYLVHHVNGDDAAMLERVDGCAIEWVGANLCQDLTVKTQRSKKTGALRQRQVVATRASFFHFFAPPAVAMVHANADARDATIAQLEVDFQRGCAIYDTVIPEALRWYTGEAVDDSEDEGEL